MPRRSRALLSTDRQVAGAKGPAEGRAAAEYRIAGTPNLVLRVTATGYRFWTYRLKRTKTGRWQKYRIGPYPAITLARARDEAVRLRGAVLDGADPFDARSMGLGIPSLRALGEMFIKRYAKPRKRTWADDERKLQRDINPVLGDCRADLVTKADIVRLVDAIHDRDAPIYANRVLALIRKLFNWAIAEGHLQPPNPAAGLPMRAREQSRRRILTDDELCTFWWALDGPGFEDVTADALRLQFLVGARIGEVTGMAKSELSLQGAIPIWVLPRERAKGGRDVPRPLPPMAVAILDRRLRAAGKSAFVFASPANPAQPITRRAPTRALQRAGEAGHLLPALEIKRKDDRRPLTAAERAQLAAFWAQRGFTPHDLRRTARTHWAKLGVMPELARRILGHAPPRADVDALVYDQHLYLEEMLTVLRKWEERLLDLVSGQAQQLGEAA